MHIFTSDEIKQYVQLNEESIAIIEDGFTKLDEGKVIMPPIMRVDVHDHNGEVDVKTAYIKGKEMFAIKVSSGFFNNYQLGLPSGNGLMMLISSITGIPQAIFLDNGYLTEVRTAVAGAIAAKYLSKKDSKTVGVIGAGGQARFQVRALKLVRDFEKILVFARSRDRGNQYAKEISKELGVEVVVATSIEQVVKNCDIVITTTPSVKPLIKEEWLHPGLHITAMGSDAENKQELEAEILSSADLYVCDTKAQCARLGELHHAIRCGLISEYSEVLELGKLTSKEVTGRENDEQITVCDLTGTGVQDTAIALFAYNEMMKHELGIKVEDKILQNK